MTRGLGQIEQEILALIEDEGEDRPYTAEELANAIYRPHAGDDGCCTRSQKVAVIRAMHTHYFGPRTLPCAARVKKAGGATACSCVQKPLEIG